MNNQGHSNGDETSISGQSSGFWFVVPAAGIGQRMQADRPKQYLSLGYCCVLEQTLNTLLSVEGLSGIVVALHPDDSYWPTLAVSKNENIHTVVGGDQRSDSVLAALHYLKNTVATNDWILVHDAARPCVHRESINDMLSVLQSDPVGGILGVPSSDTLKRVDSVSTIQSTVDRSMIWQAQTPQMFRYNVLLQSLQSATNQQRVITDEASAVEAMGYTVNMVNGRQDNIKITHPNELHIAKAILVYQQSE